MYGSDHPVLREIREGMPRRLGGICGECLMKGVCLGNCIAQNYYRSRNLWAPFWYCEEASRMGLFPPSRIKKALPVRHETAAIPCLRKRRLVVKERMKYEKPALVDLRSDSALGYTSCSPNGFSVENCNLGSCVINSVCNSGPEASECVAGNGACVPGACRYACCLNGSGVEGTMDGTYRWCSLGMNAGFDCSEGARASVYCNNRGR